MGNYHVLSLVQTADRVRILAPVTEPGKNSFKRKMLDSSLDMLHVEVYVAGTWIVRAWGKAGRWKQVLSDL